MNCHDTCKRINPIRNHNRTMSKPCLSDCGCKQLNRVQFNVYRSSTLATADGPKLDNSTNIGKIQVRSNYFAAPLSLLRITYAWKTPDSVCTPFYKWYSSHKSCKFCNTFEQLWIIMIIMVKILWTMLLRVASEMWNYWIANYGDDFKLMHAITAVNWFTQNRVFEKRNFEFLAPIQLTKFERGCSHYQLWLALRSVVT